MVFFRKPHTDGGFEVYGGFVWVNIRVEKTPQHRTEGYRGEGLDGKEKNKPSRNTKVRETIGLWLAFGCFLAVR
jgi:hypothetical protein